MPTNAESGAGLLWQAAGMLGNVPEWSGETEVKPGRRSTLGRKLGPRQGTKRQRAAVMVEHVLSGRFTPKEAADHIGVCRSVMHDALHLAQKDPAAHARLLTGAEPIAIPPPMPKPQVALYEPEPPDIPPNATAIQRAAYWAEKINATQGGRHHESQFTIARAARAAGVSESAMERAYVRLRENAQQHELVKAGVVPRGRRGYRK